MTLTARNLALGYQDTLVIPAASITLQSGHITCLIGPNGCGKSTLLRALGGLLTPRSGKVELDGQALPQWPAKTLAQRLATLPQTPVAPDNISVQQLVSHGRFPYQGLFGQNSREDIEIVNWAMRVTGMIDLSQRLFNTLSGGERQRGWIALALAQQADILLLDEPTTYLDMGHQAEILDLLATLNQSHQLTLTMVLHDINQASQYADRIIALQDGRIIADGPPANVISETLIEDLFGVKTELILRREDGRSYPYSLPVRSKKKCA